MNEGSYEDSPGACWESYVDVFEDHDRLDVPFCCESM